MQYELIRIKQDNDDPAEPVGTRESLDDAMLKDQVQRNIFMGKLDDVLSDGSVLVDKQWQ
ncbi:MAG: hypothetical protein QMB92_07225, partial [Thiopseudomonas sp.]